MEIFWVNYSAILSEFLGCSLLAGGANDFPSAFAANLYILVVQGKTFNISVDSPINGVCTTKIRLFCFSFISLLQTTLILFFWPLTSPAVEFILYVGCNGHDLTWLVGISLLPSTHSSCHSPVKNFQSHLSDPLPPRGKDDHHSYCTMHCSVKHNLAFACCPSICPSVLLYVCDVGGSGSHRLEILETNCTDN